MQKGIDYIGVGVGAVIVNSEGKVLLMKRGLKARNERGKWQIPGGGLEFGESFEDAIRREVKEELGIDIKLTKMLDVSNQILLEERQHWVSPIFLCSVLDGEPRILEPEKCDQIGWYTLKEIDALDLAGSAKKNFKKFEKEIVPI